MSDVDSIPGCHILFIGKVSEDDLSDILAFTEHRPIVTISDTEGFAEEGVLINLYRDGNRLGFEINESAVRESGLAMSYSLLNLARIVDPAGAER